MLRNLLWLVAGKSLLWVAVLGIVIFYLFAIIGFAIFRGIFDPRNQLYCSTLFECSVTIVRYGLIGDYSEVFFILLSFNTSYCNKISYVLLEIIIKPEFTRKGKSPKAVH